MKNLHSQFQEVFEQVSKSKLSKIKTQKLKIRKIKASYEHPKKWEGSNPEYYQQYLFWVFSHTEENMYHFKFFDEVRIDQTGYLILNFINFLRSWVFEF